MATKESSKSTWLEMTPKTITALRKRSEKGMSLKDFLAEAEHIAGESLIASWVASGHTTFDAILGRMDQERLYRDTAVAQSYVEDSVARPVVPEQDDIPF